MAYMWFSKITREENVFSVLAHNLVSFSLNSGYEIGVRSEDVDFLAKRYIRPLLKLLAKFFKTRDDTFLFMYLDERLRYSPHRLPRKEREVFFQGLLYCECEVLASLGMPEEVLAEYRNVNFNLIQSEVEREISILAVGDCLLNEVRVFLPHLMKDKSVDMRCIYFSANQSSKLDLGEIKKYLASFKVDLITFSFLSYEALPGYSRLLLNASSMDKGELIRQASQLIKIVKESLMELREFCATTFLLHGVSGLPLDRIRKHMPLVKPLDNDQEFLVSYLNEGIRKVSEELENCIFLDEKKVAESVGYRRVSKEIVPQSRYGGMFHTTWFGKYLAEKVYAPVVDAYANLENCKLLLVDFDNTLWNGVMADGEVLHYHERQGLLKRLKESGILLVAVSKNSPENIRWDEMTLSQDDFALLKISWNTKVQSVKEIAETLNLGTNSFVLIDDSLQERSLMKEEFPEVVCLDSLEEDTWVYLEQMLEFPNTQNTEEAKKRTQMYQDQAARKKEMEAEVDYPSMMRSLRLWYKFEGVSDKQVGRVLELISRTNQFNTTTRRYTKNHLDEMMKSKHFTLLYGELGDKFGSHGLVAVLILEEQRRDNRLCLVVDSFIMSCRAMGFSFEYQLLSEIEDLAVQMGAQTLIGKFIPTDRNSPCSTIFENAGFSRIDEVEWELDLKTEKRVRRIDWFESKTKH